MKHKRLKNRQTTSRTAINILLKQTIIRENETRDKDNKNT